MRAALPACDKPALRRSPSPAPLYRLATSRLCGATGLSQAASAALPSEPRRPTGLRQAASAPPYRLVTSRLPRRYRLATSRLRGATGLPQAASVTPRNHYVRPTGRLTPPSPRLPNPAARNTRPAGRNTPSPLPGPQAETAGPLPESPARPAARADQLAGRRPPDGMRAAGRRAEREARSAKRGGRNAGKGEACMAALCDGQVRKAGTRRCKGSLTALTHRSRARSRASLPFSPSGSCPPREESTRRSPS